MSREKVDVVTLSAKNGKTAQVSPALFKEIQAWLNDKRYDTQGIADLAVRGREVSVVTFPDTRKGVFYDTP